VDVTKRQLAEALEIQVTGRLDAYWADHLGAAIEESLHAGSHHLRVDMANVSYMSSAGIRVLVRFHKQVQRLSGSLVVVNPSAAVRDVLRMVGLELLLAVAAPEAPAAPVARKLTYGAIELEVGAAATPAAAVCRLVGDPTVLQASAVSAAPLSLAPLRVEPATLALGVGALGRDPAECRDRCGEFLGVAGAAAYLPADGTGVPDYMVGAGTLVPEVQALYAAVCEMGGASLVRFEARSGSGPFGLNALLRACLDFSGAPLAAVVMVAESAGLLGASLRRSPLRAASGPAMSFAFPEVREWLSFTPERVHGRSVALVAGLVGATTDARLGAFLRPLASDSPMLGHLHAAAFAYRPVRKGSIDLSGTVRALFEDGAPLGILHLLNDDRPIVGSGESLFVRGACWVAPIAQVETDVRPR